jgi:glucose/mannose-6-phosphate isomerase
VSSDSLAVLSSYSGNTEETLALYDEARERAVPRLGLTSGGELARRCEADGVPWVALPAGVVAPRAAVGYSLVSLAFLLEALGDPGEGDEAWAEAVAVLEDTNRRCGPARPESDNPAKLLARALVGRAVTVYAASGFPAAAARRLKGQLNENAKVLAFHEALPEMNHNEVVGWEALAELHPRFGVILLRDEADHPRVARRMDVTRQLLDGEGTEVHVVWSSGVSPLARLLSLVHFGDWLSFYLAVLAGVDPTPITKIDRLKSALAEPAEGTAAAERNPR